MKDRSFRSLEYIMTKKKSTLLSPSETIALFENKQIRRERYNDERWFNVVDIVNILSDSQSKDK